MLSLSSRPSGHSPHRPCRKRLPRTHSPSSFRRLHIGTPISGAVRWRLIWSDFACLFCKRGTSLAITHFFLGRAHSRRNRHTWGTSFGAHIQEFGTDGKCLDTYASPRAAPDATIKPMLSSASLSRRTELSSTSASTMTFGYSRLTAAISLGSHVSAVSSSRQERRFHNGGRSPTRYRPHEACCDQGRLSSRAGCRARLVAARLRRTLVHRAMPPVFHRLGRRRVAFLTVWQTRSTGEVPSSDLLSKVPARLRLSIS